MDDFSDNRASAMNEFPYIETCLPIRMYCVFDCYDIYCRLLTV